MSKKQLEYFRQRLIQWREDLIHESQNTLHHLQDEYHHEADLTDQSSFDKEMAMELDARNREYYLINQIDAALRRIDEGSYGYCEKTGMPIGLGRLEANPAANLCIEAQEDVEKKHRLIRH